MGLFCSNDREEVVRWDKENERNCRQKKKKNRGGKMEKKKEQKLTGTVEETQVLAAVYLIIHGLKLSKIKWRESSSSIQVLFFFPVLNEDAFDVIWPFAVWNAIFLSKRKKKNEEKVWNLFIQRK